MAEKISPGMQQYLDIKADYPDAFLLFRMGDFYELFYEDAVNVAQILELTLTSRNKNAEHPIPMAGVPYHAVAGPIETLVNLGYKVAIADQIEDPKEATGIVKRAVTQVITPGTAVDITASADNNFLVAIDKLADKWGLAYMDLSTGEFKVTTIGDFSSLLSEISGLRAKEIVVGYPLLAHERQILDKQMQLLISEELELEEVFENLETRVASKLLAYVRRTQLRDLSHIHEAEHYEIKDYLQMDFASKTSLELTANSREGKKAGSLYGLLDKTKTAMGTRMLKAWIERPLIKESAIEARLNAVEALLASFMERSDLNEALKGVYDLERLASRVSFGKAVPVDLIQLSRSLGNLPAIRALLSAIDDKIFERQIKALDHLPELRALIDSAIDPEAQRLISEGGIIKSGFNEQLDKYREASSKGANWINELALEEREKTGISNLRIDFNRKDGYYFHITASNLEQVPEHFFRKATLKNSERFGSARLSEIEEIMLEAKEESSKLEYKLFLEVRAETETYISRLQALAKTVAEIDCLQSLATVAESGGYIRPRFSKTSAVAIEEGRHPVVESVLGRQDYVPNSIELPEDTDIQLITGPNMSGKSTYMRQFALLVIMAQLGSYLPAESAELPIFDAIFTRIGASDNLVSGESTFMVEMSEANRAIQQATKQSLIIFDELGRGTATYDGMALAQAIIEYIHNEIGAKTLFATHYHELTALSQGLEHLTNVHVATLEKDGDVTFLHKISPGPADKSYGIHVAKIAGLPNRLLERADLILQQLEGQEPIAQLEEESQQLSLFSLGTNESEVLKRLKSMDINNMTAREAMNSLWDLKELI